MKTKLPLILGLSLTAFAGAGILPNDAVVDGRTIGEWSEEYWKWLLPISTNQNPILDTNGVYAASGQPEGSVFLVAGELGIIPGTYTRMFTVPEGKYLFLPLELYEADNVDTFPPLSLDDLRAQTAAIVDDVKELHASLDGVEIPNLFDHRAASPVFNIFYTNANNIHSFAFGHPITGLIDPMVCDGYWLMIEPLPPGPHVLHFGGSYSNAFFTPTDVLDYITVVAIPFPERIQKLIATLKVSNLSQRLHRSLLKELIQANKDFERNRVSEGVEELREFQKKVRQEVADSALAEQLVQTAQTIIDRARGQQ